jgi:hypothetical protein
MAAGELQAFNPPGHRGFGVGLLTLLLITFAVAMAGLVISPLLLGLIFAGGADYAVAGNVGQAYGAASAVIAGIALFVVLASVVVQYRQFKVMRIQSMVEFNEELVLLAMENPAYRQCWGARISPDSIDEGLFYYCSKVIKVWTIAWELGDIDEPQVRAYLKNFFDSEVPRRYWEMHGVWHRGGSRRNRRARFLELINEELANAKKGPPGRGYEDFLTPIDGFPGLNQTRSHGQGSFGSDIDKSRSESRD